MLQIWHKPEKNLSNLLHFKSVRTVETISSFTERFLFIDLAGLYLQTINNIYDEHL